jgi:hypothetical protein
MDDSFFTYLQQLELIAFFSGYPLLYALIQFIAGNKKQKNVNGRVPGSLPFAYALTGTLYLAFQLKNLYPDYSIVHIKQMVYLPWLMSWAVLAILFWIPALGKRTYFTLIHSLVFLFLFLRDLFMPLGVTNGDKSLIRNDMKLYTISLLLNLGTFLTVWLFSFLLSLIKRRK